LNNPDNKKTTTISIDALDFKVLKKIQFLKGSSPRWQVRKALVDSGIVPDDWERYDYDLKYWFEWLEEKETNGFAER
jgi:hypothetical protein